MFPLAYSPSSNLVTHFVQALLVSLMAALLATSALAFISAGPTQAAIAPPSVTGRVFMGPSGLIMVNGDGYTPGGRVQIVIVDHWGNALHEPVWTTAAGGGPFGAYDAYDGIRNFGNPGSITVVLDLDASAIYGQNGSQDPANGYQAGIDVGSLSDAGSVRIRALDEHTSTWSTFAVLNTGPSMELQRGHPIHYDVPQRCVAIIPCGVSA